MAPTLLIVGLGNPGNAYEGTRHNVGFAVVDALAESTTFRTQSRMHADIAEMTIADHRAVLAKPTTYMNESGRAIAALIRSVRMEDGRWRLLAVHDDLDLPVGTIRLSAGGSSGGQKGVQSIIDALGTKDFLRLRIGIGPNETPDGRRIPAEDFVLKKFGKEERPKIDAALTRAVEIITTLLRDDLPAAQRMTNAD